MEIKSTDPAAFRHVYEDSYAMLMRISYHIVYSQDIAEELVQEAFERFYVKSMTFPSLEDARFWLIRVTKNLALNHVKRHKRELEMLEKVKKMPLPASGNPEGAQKLVDEETIQEVRKAIESLPDNLKMVIKLKEYADLDYRGIGKVLGISESNVKVRVFRARKKLEELLGKEDGYVY